MSQRPGGTSASPQGTQTPRGNNRNPSGTSPNNPLGSRPPSPSPITPLPELPRPELASAVQITGVVQIGNKAHAIVKAPGEATSRYVTAGQRLANGRILVKRIEVREGIEPRVILEENGIEIAVTVGNSADGEASDQASLPDSAFALLPL
ncbi:MAG: hypothetical protein HC839_04245 [Leptolyngbyaceae cyanobacterium RM2_2_21]|nr:hypothetical protein [Leptolyngbyaceae cyanobacterium RM2_2_21]